MALTKAQLSLVSVATLGVAAGGYTADLAAFGTQKEAAAFIATTGLLNAGTNAEFVNTVVKNLGVTNATASQKEAFFKALEDGASRSDAAVDFANGQLVANNGKIDNVEKAIKSTSTSMDLETLKLEVTPAVNALDVTFNTANGTGFAQKDLKANLGKAQIENGAGKISADFNFNLKNQANVFTDGSTGGAPNSTVGEFTGAFLSPMLERAAAVQSDSAIYVKLLDGFALRDNVQSIERLATNGVGFTIDGELVIIADKPTDVNEIGESTGAIYLAKNYTELKDALNARIAELAATGEGAYAKLANFTVELGETFTKTNQAGDPVTGTELVIKDSAGSVLEPKGFNTFGGIHPHTDLNSINELTNVAPATSTVLISTNINAENVGYGSQGATLNIAGQSASKKGVEEFKVTATKDVWFTRLESRDTESNQHLQEVLLQSGSNGYFRVGTQDKGASLVALVDENFGVKGGGLVDVLKLDAAAAVGGTSVNAFISDDVIARNFNLKDKDANYKLDDVQINYALTGGNDVLQIAIASEVLAYADTQVSINAGAGDDLVHLKVVGNDLAVGTGKVQADSTNTYGKGWLANQQLNNNIEITANGGNNTIWTEGSGNARINTGGGNDTIYADNSGRSKLLDTAAIAKLKSLGMGEDVNALYVLNARSANIGDILSNTANKTDGVTDVAQVFNTFKNTVAVTFKGFETKYVEIASTNYTTNTQQINQAIKKAILEDATLSKLLTVKEFPGNVLVVESLIDGTQALTDLSFDFVSPVKTPTAPATLTAGQIAITDADLTAAAKAYALPGVTPAPAAVTEGLLNVETAIQGSYNLNGTGQATQFAKDGAGTGTAEVQTIDFTGVAAALATGEAGTIQIGTVNIALEVGDTAAMIATKVAAQLNGKQQAADLNVSVVSGTDAAVTATANAGVVTITYPMTGDLTAIAAPATAVVTITAPTAVQLTAATALAGEVTHISNTDLLAMATSVTKGSALAVIATEEIVINATDTAAQVGAKLAAALTGKTGADLGLTYTTAAATVTVTYDAINGLVITNATVNEDASLLAAVTVGGPAVTGTQATNITGATIAETTPGVAGTVATDVDGKASTAHSDNVINAGAGNDVVVLGTGASSNDTVVLSGNFGKTTIVNFDTTTVSDAIGNGGDLLDFRTYLDANYGAPASANITHGAATGSMAANQVVVTDFTTVNTANGNLTAATGVFDFTKKSITSLTDADWLKLLNAGTTFTTTEKVKNVILVKNDATVGANAGEYIVLETTGAATAADATAGKFAGVKIVGTLDFGTDAAGADNFVGFDVSNLVTFG